MEKKQKILLVHNYYKIPGGEDSVVFNEKKLLEEHGHEVILYTRSNSEIYKFGICKKFALLFTSVFNRKTYRDIKKIIRKEKIDIVHVHNTLSLISPSVFYAARECGVPVVQTIHNFRMICPGATLYRNGNVCEECLEKGLHCAIRHKCYRNSSLQTRVSVSILKRHRRKGIFKNIHFICLTEFNKNKLLTDQDLCANQIFVKPNFVQHTGNVLPFSQRENRIIFVGRLELLKGIDCLFKAWHQMGEKAPTLQVCGTGQLEEWCRNYIHENHIENIEMMGFVDNKTTKELIGKSKALILPTRCYEGFPMTIAEAFSVGTPVLGTEFGNTGNLIEEGVTGWKFDPANCDSIANAVESIVDVVDKVYVKFCENYTADKNYEILQNIYNSITNKK